MWLVWGRIAYVAWPRPYRCCGGVELTCPACAVTGILTVDQAWVLWGEQMRKDRILALAGLVPEDLDRT